MAVSLFVCALGSGLNAKAAQLGSQSAREALAFDPFHPQASALQAAQAAKTSAAAPADPNDVVVLVPGSAVVFSPRVADDKTIINPPPPVTVNVLDAAPVPGYQSNIFSRFTVALAKPSKATVTVFFTTLDGTATAGKNYMPASGQLRFQPGQTVKTVSVKIIPDFKLNVDKFFYLVLSNPDNATLGRSVGRAVLKGNNTQPVTVNISDAPTTVIPNGSTGLTARFTVSLSRASTSLVSAFYATRNGNAGGGVNYDRVSGWLRFQPGQTVKTVSVPLLADPNDAGQTRVFYVDLLDSINAAIGRKTGQEIIIYPPGSPSNRVVINVSNAADVIGYTSGSHQASFLVTLSHSSTSEVTAYYSTANGTAGSGWDYKLTSGQLKFSPGETQKVVNVPVFTDLDGNDSGVETFTLGLLSVKGADVGQGEGLAKIIEFPAGK